MNHFSLVCFPYEHWLRLRSSNYSYLELKKIINWLAFVHFGKSNNEYDIDGNQCLNIITKDTGERKTFISIYYPQPWHKSISEVRLNWIKILSEFCLKANKCCIYSLRICIKRVNDANISIESLGKGMKESKAKRRIKRFFLRNNSMCFCLFDFFFEWFSTKAVLQNRTCKSVHKMRKYFGKRNAARELNSSSMPYPPITHSFPSSSILFLNRNVLIFVYFLLHFLSCSLDDIFCLAEVNIIYRKRRAFQ